MTINHYLLKYFEKIFHLYVYIYIFMFYIYDLSYTCMYTNSNLFSARIILKVFFYLVFCALEY